MKVKATLSIGYPTAVKAVTLEIPDEELEGMTEDERNEYIDDEVMEWAHNYIEVDWKPEA